ncbi:MAG: 6,7-dimethyl-8-ribityllumazine synthase [Nitrospirae bacterium]|nr:6,7-dimethyl-8-ribityllumazine synthase [Nitrospirota bacterium]MBI3351226.1 6,7-dimethyl-8-ribityllumazine synthase [Nitrospirota bacterium]
MRVPVKKPEALKGGKLTFAVIVSRFNPEITGRLLKGAMAGLKECQVDEKNIVVFEVPGAFEIPQAAAQVAKYRKVDAVICLGAVIRGETPHFEYISSETSRGIMEAGTKTGVPVLFGVLTVNSLQQAMKRAIGKNNKGREAALSAVEMAQLFKRIKAKMAREATG